MKSLRRFLATLPGVLALAAGCGSGTPPPSSPGASADVAPAASTPSEDEDESSAELKEHHRHHHHGGFPMFVAMSLDSLGTTPEQGATITKIQTDLRAQMQPAHDAEKKVLLVLADGVDAGAIDKAKVDAALAQVSSASAGVHDAVVGSMNQLHDALTPAQRLALVDKLEAHFKVWHGVNADEGATGKSPQESGLAKLAKELGLSPNQVDKVRASLRASAPPASYDTSEAEAHLKAFGAAFEGNTFDAKTVTTGGPASAHLAAWGTGRMVRLYEALTPVLTADQRTRLSASLRKHANYTPTQTGL